LRKIWEFGFFIGAFLTILGHLIKQVLFSEINYGIVNCSMSFFWSLVIIGAVMWLLNPPIDNWILTIERINKLEELIFL